MLLPQSQPLLRALQAAVQPLLAAHFAGETGSQRHQTILEPNFFQPEFLEFLNLETLNHAAAEIIGVDHPASLSFSGLALLMGHTEPTALNWHRDFGDDHPESPQLWERPTGFIQFNCALFDDPSLWFVPSSHNRPSTSPELSTAGSWPSQDRSLPLAVANHKAALERMPGGNCVDMQAGDCLLYNPLSWHGASYVSAAVASDLLAAWSRTSPNCLHFGAVQDPTRVRATFHGGWRHPDMPYLFEAMRWGIDQNPWYRQHADHP